MCDYVITSRFYFLHSPRAEHRSSISNELTRAHCGGDTANLALSSRMRVSRLVNMTAREHNLHKSTCMAIKIETTLSYRARTQGNGRVPRCIIRVTALAASPGSKNPLTGPARRNKELTYISQAGPRSRSRGFITSLPRDTPALGIIALITLQRRTKHTNTTHLERARPRAAGAAARPTGRQRVCPPP